MLNPKKSVRLRLSGSLAVCIVLLLIVGALGIYSAQRSQGSLETTFNTNVKALEQLGIMRTAILSNRVKVVAEQRDQNVATVASTQAEMAQNDVHTNAAMQTYLSVISDEQERAQATRLQQSITALQGDLQRMMTMMAAGDFTAASAFNAATLRGDYQVVIDGIAGLFEGEVARAAQHNQNSLAAYEALRNTVLGVIALAIALALALSVWLVRGIMTPLSKARHFANELALGNLAVETDVTCKDEFGDMLRALTAMQQKMAGVIRSVSHNAVAVNDSAQDISRGNEDLNRRTQEQAASLEETAASMEEITTTVRHNADNAAQADRLVREVSQQAQTGGNVVQSAVSAMGEISASSHKIATIVSLIDEIAFQTNLLALNASVEAARAGEQGRGFAVVANEVRNLAGRSANAAREIKQLVEESVKRVDTGAELVNRSGQTLTEIVSSVKRVTDLVSEIAVASREQATGIDQVNVAVSQMDAVTQQNAALVEESSMASRALRNRAAELQQEISFFKVDTSASDGVSTGNARPISTSITPPVRSDRTSALAARTELKRPAAQRQEVEEWAEF
ncbi:methyl-accepting chemotaxis protein/methyl-accepting chemotaxis protein-1, serine sensor receptor [Kushneria avicenniae]|uniref:Methyl-accepting chemotaxis protein/methyl-accepting chemotaxis protein-1, serine sensor receptor n=1 Tax=Kushneria avicenniae TaxID=402385 RepID=A0A1I1GII6_9GAMM|nr:methyl-accepting chemotaxis protein [Kushneria avicenniae]SFC11589.1 methyl-accepting chemotaxis protein/methyl-accepting chemotaxis protein-1, serine sensor receptor [Kushneria avicenniae]